jgi:membrane fusion protein (multidrug efflux system)
VEPDEKKPNSRNSDAQPKKSRRLAIAILAVLVIGGIAVTYYFWHKAQIFVSTDDAFVEGHIHFISSRVEGTVMNVAVESNQSVDEGQLLVELDRTPFEVAVRDAEAALELAVTEVNQLRARVTAAEARLSLSKATLEQAEVDLRRIQSLVNEAVAPQDDLDRAATAREVAAAGVKAAAEEVRRARAALGPASKDEIHPLIKKRQAELDRDRLDLSYTSIYAPAAGYVTRKSVEVGNRIQPSQPLMSVVPLDDTWIVANYKETQMKRVRVGQPVEIDIDTYPGLKLEGRVESIMAGTGAVFSLFPPENATGNFVKVVQRIPVKIVLDEKPGSEHILRVGMSVITTIDTTAN